MQVLDVFVNRCGINFFISFEQRFKEIEKTHVQLQEIAILMDHFFLNQYFETIFIIF